MAGYHDFVIGEVVTAATMDDFVGKQVIGVYASTAARDTALAAVLREGIFAYVQAGDILWYYDGAAWGIVTEPRQSWNPTSVTQSGAVACTNSNAWYQRQGGIFVAHASLAFTGAGTAGNAITLPLPTPTVLDVASNIDGTFSYVQTGTTIHAGTIWGNTTTTFRLQVSGNSNQLGVAPSFAIANTHTMTFTVTGGYA